MAARETARRVAIGIAGGRIALGVGALIATRPALRALGFPGTDSSGHALARLAGGRDLALGALTLAARDRTGPLRALVLAGASLDAADALTLGLAGRKDSELRLAGIGGVVSGGGAALAGAWAWRRLQA
jgi:hypothetical protein